MAEASISIDQDHFNCSICLQLLKDPVTTPCGHSFCIDCINGYWDQDSQRGLYSCPQCRETFNPRPTLRRNNMLTELVDTLQKTEVQDSFSTFLDLSCPTVHDVECDSCIGEKNNAVLSCLTCLASYCETHILPHRESPAFKRHQLVTAVSNLQGKICAQHNKILDHFCRTDQIAVCYECSTGKHNAHDIISIEEDWKDKKKDFVELQLKLQKKLEKREKTLLELEELMKSFKHGALGAVEDSEKTFSQMILFIEKRRSAATALIRAQEKAELDRATEVQEKLKQEIAKLQQKGTRLEKLSDTNDYVHFLQCFQFLRSDLETDDTFKMVFNQQWLFEHFKTSVSQLKKQTQELCQEKWDMISKNVNFGLIIPFSEPETREEFLKYSCELSLDPNTVNCYLWLSDGNTQVSSRGQRYLYSDHPERFSHWQQVLCKQALPQRCYWEAEVSGDNGVSIAVSSKKIRRNGSALKSRFGHNDESWRLVCYPAKYSFWHKDVQVVIPGPASKRIGVYLDQKMETLSFYSVSNRMSLIHKVTSTFTEPLYLGFGLGSLSSAKICLQAYAAASSAADECAKKK